jgi:PKD repeat protein
MRGKSLSLIVVVLCGGLLAACPVAQPPVAAFRASQTVGDPPLTVQFTDLSLPGDQPIESWFWDFGDNTTSTDRNPVHVYEQNGLYSVSLTVDGPVASSTLTLNNHILVGYRFQVHLVNSTPFPITELYVDEADAQLRGPDRVLSDVAPGQSVTLPTRYQKGQHIVQVVLSAEVFAIVRYIPGNLRTLDMPDAHVTIEVVGEDPAALEVIYRFGRDEAVEEDNN